MVSEHVPRTSAQTTVCPEKPRLDRLYGEIRRPNIASHSPDQFPYQFHP